MSRNLYLVCYDVSDPRRLYRVHRQVQAYAVGGQKSFYECWMTAPELAALRTKLANEIDANEDRVHFFQLDPRIEPLYFGRARPGLGSAFMIL